MSNTLKLFVYIGIFMLFLIHTNLIAKELRWTHFGLRPLSMGNAYIAVADDYNALFYNPAGLARLKEWDGEFFNPALEITTHTLDFINDLTKFVGGNASSFTDALDLVRPQLGRIHHFAMYWTPHLIFKGFGFGIGMANAFNIVPHSDIDFEIDAGSQIIAPFSYALNLFENRLSLGFSVKALFSARIDDSFNIETLSAFSKDNTDPNAKKIDDMIKIGNGYGADFGLLFTPIETMKPTFGLSVIDIGGSSYTKQGSNKVGTPSPRFPTVNTGISLIPYQTARMYLLVAADAHMINQPVHYSHKYNLGVEWGLGDIIKVQSGLKEGYFTAGFQFDVGLLNVRFASYFVDHAPVVGVHKGLVERRYALQIKLLI